jgi:hypothetical protein
MTERPITAALSYPGGTSDVNCDDLVVVAFNLGYRDAISYVIFQPLPDRRVKLNAAKALLAELAEDESDIYGQAAARALEKIHRKL